MFDPHLARIILDKTIIVRGDPLKNPSNIDPSKDIWLAGFLTPQEGEFPISVWQALIYNCNFSECPQWRW